MRIYSSITWDIASMTVLDAWFEDYQGEIYWCKGGNSQQEMRRANELQDQQLQLMRQMLGRQQGAMDIAQPQLEAIIKAGGMSPEQEAAMRSIAINDVSGQFSNLQGALQNRMQQRGITGGQMAGSGDIGRDFGQLGALEAGEQARLMEGIQVEKGHGLMDALRTQLGIGGMYGSQAMGFGGQGVNALGIGQRGAQAADEASTGFWGSLFGALGSVGGGLAGRH